MNNMGKVEKIVQSAPNGIITAAQLTKAGLHRGYLHNFVESGELYRFGRGLYVQSSAWEDDFYLLQQKYSRGIYSHDTALYRIPSGNPIRVYDLERTLCDILRGSGIDIQIVGAAMKRYAASKDKDIHKLMQYAERLRVKPKVLRYMEILL